MRHRLEWLLLGWVLGAAPLAWGHPFHLPRVPHRDQWEQRWRRLPPTRRQEILRARRRFRRLPPEQQQRLWAEYRKRHRERPDRPSASSH
ncbi:MAG TPA: hypothetical protein VFN52_05760 [Acidiferrobacteraceae bacterium]|nr:hypothetical protein [Acidiferrobacteraceae bacterium]